MELTVLLPKEGVKMDKLFNKTLSALEIVKALLDEVRKEHPELDVGTIRDAEPKVHPPDGADFTTIELKQCNVGGYWKLNATVHVENSPGIEDYRDGSSVFTIERTPPLFPAEKHEFFGRVYNYMICNGGYQISEFESRESERANYKCPHCGSRRNHFHTTDSDLGCGPVIDVYQCDECGRYFDEPLRGDVGISRS